MMVFKILHSYGVFRGQRQFDKPAIKAMLADVIQINIQFTEPDLDSHFPKSGGTDVDIGSVFNQLSGFTRQFGVITERPEQNMCIKQ